MSNTINTTAQVTLSKFYGGSIGSAVNFILEDGTKATWSTKGNNPFYKGRTYEISARNTGKVEYGNIVLSHVKRVTK